MTTDNQASPDDVAAAFARDGYYYTSQPLRLPAGPAHLDGRGAYYLDLDTQTWVCEWEPATPQDDFIRKGRGVLLALGFGIVFWVLVFLLIGGV